MEEEEVKNENKTPLLEGWKLSGSGRRSSHRISRRNSVTSLRGDFLARLPEKVKSCVNDNGDVESCSNIDLSKSSCLTKGEKDYYEKQFETLKSFEEVDSIVASNCIDAEDLEEQAQHERAMKISNYANVVLLALKIYATVKSGSLAIAASTLDSLLDLMAGGILWLTHLSMKNINIYKYPIGKLRVQPVGIIIFAAIMATLATVVKLALWLYCRSSGNNIVRAYAKDHYFDVVTNVVGLVAAVLGDKFYWWIDPVGALILAIYTISNWSGTVLENAASLVGQSAPPEYLQKLTYLVIRHPQVKRVDTVRAYTFGVLYFVEVDIELPEDLPLKEAHTIGETLQINLEKLPDVERAFVHLDFECEHKPEHSVLSRLPNTEP
ncbi:PREDICTED: metal tolerance protein 4-like isoform X2 [Nicotiana attenuata]|uniref:metal tolerance protein 4-like isoform X2 n=1 Tax=Nicotiana attenuata TaxID=49451 RepID=UPI000904F9E2|nr:PREDICTED: metal tolerance protein 4-like isoform X2 [Nicotiana attenuata]